MKLLDLFCCCGGISKGYHDAGFNECTGIDINDNHKYPYNFIHSDVFKLPLSFFEQFDLIHASPPCQHYTFATKKINRDKHPDLVEKTRLLLQKTGKPYTIENVPNAPLRKDLILCGEMFPNDNLRIIRHRIFEIEGFNVIQPTHRPHKPTLENGRSYYAQIAGHGGDSYSFKIEDWKKAIGIDWVNDKNHLTQMIPPIYSKYIGLQFLKPLPLITNFMN
ncbi:MAG TPA: DNA cytosine methyltransferase [Nitrososphaeraceae archaeon]|nr:DNA cytosine methyltransferase [Nitrososphaeraceae archaeon]